MLNDVEHLYGQMAGHQLLIEELLVLVTLNAPTFRARLLQRLDGYAVHVAEERDAGKWRPDVAEGILKTLTETRNAITEQNLGRD